MPGFFRCGGLRGPPFGYGPGMRTALLSWIAVVASAAPLASQVVPAPKRIERTGEVCRGNAVRCDVDAFRPQLAAFVRALGALGVDGLSITAQAGPDDVVVFERGDAGGDEHYRIGVRDGALVVTAGDPTAIARATATLLQLAQVEDGQVAWPGVRIEDGPDHAFRAFMVDMGRNPHDPATLRRVVDTAWFYKVAFLHLHLSDDQLFSWPSRVFPKLYSERAGWTWHHFVALEAYSQARGVTIVPEIDVPGHSTILRRAYPEVFGANPTELASKPEARRGIERLIAELLSVFEATPFVHIGGDEAYGVPADVQRDFINRLDRFVNAQGRRTIVWEGPPLGAGEHEVDTDVLHVNWQTVGFPAQQMLDAGYQVVNAAWDPLYVVDHYPRTMFTAVPVERCYGWDPRRFAHVAPGMPTFANPHVTKTAEGILGFCMPWWEGRPENLLPLCAPRLAAVASAAWNRDGEQDFADFEARQARLLPRLEAIAGFRFPELPFADPAMQVGNLAFRAKVTPSTGASQPVFGPQRLTNGITERFDHFLGYPTQPEPLEIVIDLGTAAEVGRVVVHETAVGESYEVYELLVSADGREYEKVGATEKGTRGERSFVEHIFAPRAVRYVKIRTLGCHGLTFPSFSRLTEVMVFER